MGVTSENVTPMSDDTQPLIRTIDSLSLSVYPLLDSWPQKGDECIADCMDIPSLGIILVHFAT